MDLSPPAGLFTPVAEAANATLKFVVAAAGGSVDAATGNYIPATSTVTVSAKVSQARDNTEIDLGVDQNTVAITGWFVNPTQPPVTIFHGMTVDAVVNGVKGAIEFLDPLQNGYVTGAIANGSWGFRFAGKFRREV